MWSSVKQLITLQYRVNGGFQRQVNGIIPFFDFARSVMSEQARPQRSLRSSINHIALFYQSVFCVILVKCMFFWMFVLVVGLRYPPGSSLLALLPFLMPIAVSVLNLFLLLFRCCLSCVTRKHTSFPKVFLVFLENRHYRRYFESRGIKPPFQPWEKQAVAECFALAKNPSRFFSLFSSRTILTAWKNAIARHWTVRHKPGRPPLSKAVKELVLKLKKENFLWGARRIRDELKKLSIDVSHETISKILRRFRKKGDLKPSLSWKHFLSSHWSSLFACDFFTATIFGMTTFYVFFIIELKTRKIVQHGITANPNMQFLRNQFSAFEYEHPGSTVIHDNSGELKWFPYVQYNFKDMRIVPYSPDMNAYAERFVRSIRQECLDHFVIFTHGQLSRIVKGYIDYYNDCRPHQGLKGIPNGPPEPGPGTGEIKQKPLLFGLHNHYYRESA